MGLVRVNPLSNEILIHPPFEPSLLLSLNAEYDRVRACFKTLYSPEKLKVFPKGTKIIVEELPEMSFKTEPFFHQKLGLSYVLNHPYFALFWEMGTGKTKVMIDMIRYLLENDPEYQRFLIVCPLSVVYSWKEEFEKHSDLSSEVELLVGERAKRKSKLEKDKHIYVINYDGARVIPIDLLAKRFDVIIADESQMIKDLRRKRTKIMLRLAKRAKRRYILTGTPILNNPLELFSQILFLDQGETFGWAFTAFRERYYYKIDAGYPKLILKDGALEDIREKISPLSHRVLKEECLELPERTWMVRYCELSENQKKVYNELANNFVIQLKNGDSISAFQAITQLMKFQQITSGFLYSDSGGVYHFKANPKLEALKDIAKELDKFVVFYKFKAEAQIIKEALEKLGFKVVVISGDQNTAERERVIEKFNSTDAGIALLGQIQCAALGLNLQTATYGIFYSNDFSYGLRYQAEARLHRIGSKGKITYIDLIAKNTIDESIKELLEKKKDLSDRLTGDYIRKLLRGEAE